MNVDVSEMKDFRHCKRKWELASRNSFHLRPCVTPVAFKLGTTFHECLHRLYLGWDADDVVEYMKDQMDGAADKDIVMLHSMIKGYAKEVIPKDKCFKTIDIEWHFDIAPEDMLDATGQEQLLKIGVATKDLHIVGSIDMIALNNETNEIWGFEHKTAKNFRNDTYLWLDEQPRVYYAALQKWVRDYNACHEEPVKLGGVYINEVRKLIRAFEYKRSELTYPIDDIRNFMLSFLTSCAECHKYATDASIPRIPSPDMMTCQMCQYNIVCQKFQYQNLDKHIVLQQFSTELKERDGDHLNDKEERTSK